MQREIVKIPTNTRISKKYYSKEGISKKNPGIYSYSKTAKEYANDLKKVYVEVSRVF